MYSDISSEILFFIYFLQSICLSIRHIYIFFFWHSFWHYFSHFVWSTCWHSIWHLFSHSLWHIFWHPIWHSIWIRACTDWAGARDRAPAHACPHWAGDRGRVRVRVRPGCHGARHEVLKRMHLCLTSRDPHLAPLACSLWILSFHTTNTCTTAPLLQGTWRELNGAVPPAGPNFELGLQAAMRGVPNTSSRSDHGHGDSMVTAPWKSWAGTIGPTSLLNVFTFFAWRHSYLQAAINIIIPVHLHTDRSDRCKSLNLSYVPTNLWTKTWP